MKDWEATKDRKEIMNERGYIMNKITNFLCLSLLLLSATALGMDTPEEQLVKAAGKGQLEEVERLIAQGVSIEATDRYNCTPMHRAAQNGCEDVCRLLLGKGASVGAKNNVGWTPLHWAALKGHTALCELLIENNALIDVKANDRETPLHCAIQTGKEAVCRLLILNKASLETKDYNGNTALHNIAENYATAYAYKPVCKLLIENKASAEMKNNQGKIPLACAIDQSRRAGKLLIDAQLETAEKNKAAIITFLGIAAKRKERLYREQIPCDVAQMIARQALEAVKRDRQSIIEQINKINKPSWIIDEWLNYVKQQMNSPIK